jgi:hypothetical protein
MQSATIHTTACGRYVVSADGTGRKKIVCRSLGEAYDILRDRRIATAVLAQRVAADEMIGQPSEDAVSRLELPVPGV